MKKIIFSVIGLALMFGLVGVAGAAEAWNLQGTYTIDFVCTSVCSGTYTHTMTVSSYDIGDGTFTGTGWRNAVPSQAWIVSGGVNGSDVSFLVDYDSSTYFVNVIGTIKSDGTMFGTATSSSNQTFTWSTTSGAAVFNRHAEITSPEIDEIAYSEVKFAAYLVDNDSDYVDWAVRKGTCAAGTNTVFGNVDGYHDVFDISYNSAEYKYSYSITTDVSTWAPGMYCFIFNPREDAGETNIRLTRQFTVALPTKAKILIESGVSGKGLENASGLQKSFNPKSQADKHAGKK